VGGTYTDATTSRYGQDQYVYKLGENGEPVSVYAADLTTVEGGTPTSESAAVRSYPTGLAAIGDDVFVAGAYYGKLTFPNAKTGGNIELVNGDSNYDLWVAKLDMCTTPPSARWAVSTNLTAKLNGRGIAATAEGHVLTFADIKGGSVTKFSGIDGAIVWEKTFKDIGTFRDGKMSTSGEKLYMTGTFKGKDSTTYAPALATMTSCDDGEKISAVVAEFDVADTDGPVAKWVTNIGCGGSSRGAKGTFVEGNYLYVVGELSAASVVPHHADSTVAACTMDGQLGGFLVKLHKDNGLCVWAKDMGGTTRVVANADFVWTEVSTDETFRFDADHTFQPTSDQVLMGKFRALDGVGLWGTAVGGAGRDEATAMAMTPTGPVVTGYHRSDALTVGAVTATNLQNQANAANAGGAAPPYAMWAMKLALTDAVPPCLTCADGADLADGTITASKCYADGQCIDSGSFSTVNPCFQCDPDTAQTALTTVTVDHCFIDNKCVAKGSNAPAFRSYNTPR